MNTILNYCVRVLMVGFLFLSAFPVMSEEDPIYIPLAGYDSLVLESRSVLSPSLGAILIGENFSFTGIYTHSSFSTEEPKGYPEAFHSIDGMFEVHAGKHQLVSILKSESDQPIYGGWETFQTAVIYNFRLIENKSLNISLGGGAVLSDFGIDLENGKPWPLLPVPYISIKYSSANLEAGFDFITGPVFNMALFPESKFHCSLDLQMDEFRDLRDLLFDASLEYRFFEADHPFGDFAGIAAGVRNNSSGFTSGESEESYEIQYYALYTELDLSLLKISGGYAFGGRERLGDMLPAELGDGYFLTVQGLYQF